MAPIGGEPSSVIKFKHVFNPNANFHMMKCFMKVLKIQTGTKARMRFFKIVCLIVYVLNYCVRVNGIVSSLS